MPGRSRSAGPLAPRSGWTATEAVDENTVVVSRSTWDIATSVGASALTSRSKRMTLVASPNCTARTGRSLDVVSGGRKWAVAPRVGRWTEVAGATPDEALEAVAQRQALQELEVGLALDDRRDLL